MSTEGKKKRGEAGLSNAQNSPFRINGWRPDWAAAKAGAYSAPPAASSGSKTMRGILGGSLAEALGFSFAGSAAIYDRMIGHAAARCSHPLLRMPEESGEELRIAA